MKYSQYKYGGTNMKNTHDCDERFYIMMKGLLCDFKIELKMNCFDSPTMNVFYSIAKCVDHCMDMEFPERLKVEDIQKEIEENWFYELEIGNCRVYIEKYLETYIEAQINE